MTLFGRMRPARWTAREAAGVLALGTICLALLGLIMIEANTLPASPDDVALPPHPPTIRTEGAAPAAALPPIEALAEVVERPVFSQTRRPSEQAEEAAGQAEALALQGIVVSASDRIALIGHGQPIKTARVKEGQTIEGWTVRTISADRVLIENAGTEHELRLGKKSSQAAVGQSGG